MILRLAVLCAGLALFPLSAAAHQRPIPSPHHAGYVVLSHLDQRVGMAATARAGKNTAATVRWLNGQRSVQSVRLGAGAAIDIRFRDGGELLVLSRSFSTGRGALPRPALLQPRVALLRQTSRDSRQVGPARALVLEPFADELGLGSDAGLQEANDLTRAGFQVDVLRNSAVSVATMATLSSYSVVYFETHADPLKAGGDAVVATGEVYTDGTYPNLYADGSLREVTVAGDTKNFYDAVTGAYFTQHLGNFPNKSIMFIEGCGTLNASLFWRALQQRNVDALIGWDHDVPSVLSSETGAYVVSRLAAPLTVADSVAAATEQGLAVGITDKGTTKLGFLGDGLDTLAAAAGEAPPTPIPTATSMPTSTSTPAATPLPTATSTPIPPTVKPVKKHRSCRPGHHRVHGRCRLIKHHKKHK